MTKPIITALDWVPDGAKGLVRDLRVRWALEEVGQPYDVRLLRFGTHKEGTHRARQPFGQVPTYEEDGLVLFESGAIVLHIAERHPGLLPDDPKARARAIRSEEHTSELQSLMRISYAVFCLKKNTYEQNTKLRTPYTISYA